METPSPFMLAQMVLAAPAWAQIGITAPSERLREEAALELGTVIANRIERPVVIVPDGQLRLPL